MKEYRIANVTAFMKTLFKAAMIAIIFGGGWAFLYLIFKALT